MDHVKNSYVKNNQRVYEYVYIILKLGLNHEILEFKGIYIRDNTTIMGYITNYVQVGLKMLDIQTYEHFMRNIIVFVGNMIISPQKMQSFQGNW